MVPHLLLSTHRVLATILHQCFLSAVTSLSSASLIPVRGHPFMTSTWRGRGWTHVDGGRGPPPCGHPHRKLKLESTDIILSSSHAKKLATLLSEFRLWTEKSGNFSAI